VLLALKVRFQPEMALKDLERAINGLEERIRAELPMMKKIFVEPDSEYDGTLDPEVAPSLRPTT
jgi:hypothetical protein